METTEQKTKRISWELSSDETILSVTFPDETVESFDVLQIFPDFAISTLVQKYVIVYGLKQILADCISGMGKKGFSSTEMIETMNKRFNNMVEGKVRAEKKTRQTKAEIETQIQAEIKARAEAKLSEKERAMWAKLNAKMNT